MGKAVRPKGNKGPEALKPFTQEAAQIAGMALAAACRNDWSRAREWLAKLSDDDLETLFSVGFRFSHKAVHEVEFERLAQRRGFLGCDVGRGVGLDELLGDSEGPFNPEGGMSVIW
jgi:hypothetical protein